MRLILTTDTVGGVWTFTRELALELLQRGHEICLVSFGRAPSAEQQQVARNFGVSYPTSFRYEAGGAPLEWMQSNEGSYTEGASLLLSLEKSFRPDAYLFSQYCFGVLPVTAPKVIVAHSDVLSWAAACTESLDESSAWMRTYRQLVGDGLLHADAVVSPTAAYLEELRSHFPALPPSQQVIANGRSVSSAAQEKRTVQAVTAGRLWDKGKNLRLLTETALPIPVIVAGESEGVHVEDDRLRWIGQQDEAALLRLFCESTVYLCTSVYEPFGLAALEAALCGCAVIAMDIPTLREVWGESALYFHDAATLSGLLAELSTAPMKLSRMQEMSRARAATYSAARMADRYLDLLESLINREHLAEAHAA